MTEFARLVVNLSWVVCISIFFFFCILALDVQHLQMRKEEKAEKIKERAEWYKDCRTEHKEYECDVIYSGMRR